MRFLFSGAIGVLALAAIGPAYAADLPTTKGPPAFTPPPPVFTWTGVYIGGQVGYQWGRTSYTATNAGVLVPEPGYTDNGVVGGGHIGYNYQLSQFVLGVEGDLEGTSFRGANLLVGGLGRTATRIDIEGSVRGRLGYAWDRALFYATGGVAFADFRDSLTSITPLFNYAASSSFGRVGWTVGGGVEYAIDNNWSVRAEYRYTAYSGYTYALPVGPGVFPGSSLNFSRPYDNRVEAGFSYKFDTFAPVVSKY